MLLKKIFPFLYKTSFSVLPGHEVELAFVSNGIEYFSFINGFDAYYDRYMAAIDAINALEQRVSRDYLLTHTKLMSEYLNAGKLTLASVLNHNLEERMKHVCNVDLLYQLAAVWYFDKSENCYAYNTEYGEKKIALWRKDKEVLSFFLQSPLRQYMPLANSSQFNIKTYTRAQRLEELSTLRYHLLQLSETPNNHGLISDLQSKIQKLEELLIQVE